MFDTSIEGILYQVVALVVYQDASRERLDRVFGVAVNLEWARDHYFSEILNQVAPIAGNAGANSFAIVDDHSRRIAGTLEPASHQNVATRVFPVLFFDPTVLAIDPPADLTQRSWTIAASAAADPTFVLAGRGARRSLVVVGAGVALLAISLIATARAARASAALALVRAEFVSTVTHELKTPLSTIRAVGETLVRGRVKTDQDLKRYAHLLVREERRLTRLVNNLLAYSRVTDVTEVYSFEALEPAALISEATQGFRRQLTDSDVRLEIDVPPELPAVRADRTAVVLALDNLIDNAIRHSGEAETVSVRASGEADRVRFDVIDHGVGIPADDLPQVKRRFVRGEDDEGPRQRTGPRDRQSHRRRSRWRTRDYERGWPRDHGDADSPEGGNCMRPRILIVEDDSSLVQILRDNLIVDGFDVECASHADKALVLYRSFVPDLVLVDVMLPDLSGFELARVLRHGGKTPIIILSARGEKADKLTGLRLGADDYITKPFDMEELVARINTVLRRVKPTVTTIRLAGVTIDFRSGIATGPDGDLHLSHREFEILRVLAERNSRVVFRDELFREVWGFLDTSTTRSVDRAVSRLRQKIEADPKTPRFLRTVHGDGYILTPEVVI